VRVKEKDVENLKKLPDWVKCVKCGGKPLQHDWLIEIIPHSSALIHQSCALNLGKVAGIDIGKGHSPEGE
jgi:hypothetical protein